MTSTAPPSTPPAADARVIGRHDTDVPGPTVLLIAAAHGNEPAGLAAARQVFLRLQERGPIGKGRVVALVANLPGLAAGRRYVDRDLNRLWTPEQVAHVDASSSEDDDVEQGEQRELLRWFRELGARAAAERQPLVFIDLHSTSGPSSPFTVINDTLPSRRLALASPVPLVLGLEEVVRGTLLDYVEQRGHPCVLVEGGQHEDPRTARSLEAAVWHMLAALEMVPSDWASEAMLHDDRDRDGATPAPPRVVELTYVHEIASAEDFRMRPGYRTFSPIAEGELLADDNGVEVRAPTDGVLLLPLYQAWGHDGFFIGQPVNRAWLRVSSVVRALGVARVLPWLPGVSPDPARSGTVYVNRHVARWFVIEIFHLAGYRRLPSSKPGWLCFRRRAGT